MYKKQPFLGKIAGFYTNVYKPYFFHLTIGSNFDTIFRKTLLISMPFNIHHLILKINLS